MKLFLADNGGRVSFSFLQRKRHKARLERMTKNRMSVLLSNSKGNYRPTGTKQAQTGVYGVATMLRCRLVD
jgi:hypothetical protein